MPSKVYEIMASGRPLLASADPGTDLWKLVKSTGCGVCVRPEDPEELAEALLTLYRDPQRRREMGERGCRAAEQSYSSDSVVAAYDWLLRQVAEDHWARSRGVDQRLRKATRQLLRR